MGRNQEAVLAASPFKKGAIVEVVHPIYSGRGTVLQAGWLENICRRAGEPEHYLCWIVMPDMSDDFPGVVDIIDPQYGFEEEGKSIRLV